MKKLQDGGLEDQGLFYSQYPAVVVDNKDPEQRNRLLLKCESVWGENNFEKWVMPIGVFSGSGFGLFITPPVDTTVSVIFEQGDPEFPRWIHGWFAQNEAPTETNWKEGTTQKRAYPNNHVFKTPAGNMVEFDDENKRIRFKNSTGKIIEINESGIALGSVNAQKKATEPAVLGNKLKQSLDNLCTELSGLCQDLALLTVTCAAPGSPSTVPVNAAAFGIRNQSITQIKNNLQQIISEITSID